MLDPVLFGIGTVSMLGQVLLSLARAYAVECSGSVFSGLLSAVLLYFGIQNLAQEQCPQMHESH